MEVIWKASCRFEGNTVKRKVGGKRVWIWSRGKKPVSIIEVACNKWGEW